MVIAGIIVFPADTVGTALTRSAVAHQNLVPHPTLESRWYFGHDNLDSRHYIARLFKRGGVPEPADSHLLCDPSRQSLGRGIDFAAAAVGRKDLRD